MRRPRNTVRTTGVALAAVTSTFLAAVLAGSGGASASPTDSGGAATQHEQPGYVRPEAPAAAPGDRLLVKKGSVAVDTNLTVATDASSDSLTFDATGSRDAAGGRSADLQAAAKPTPPPSVPARKVTLRALVVALDDADYGLPTWTRTLDNVGAQYDVVRTKSDTLTAADLVQPDGTGRYNAILLTDAMQAYTSDGSFVSGLSNEEWNLLWAYERDYDVRQATLYASYGAWPEDYCLRAGSEGTVGDTPLPASLTPRGAAVFDYLNSSATVPIVQSYVYQDTLESGCDAEPVLTAGDRVLGVRTVSTDGRQRLALTFTSNQNLLQANLLVFGLFRWASRGLYLGEQRHFLNVDVDDWFNSTDERLPDGTINSDPGYRMTAHDAYNTSLLQKGLRSTYPLASAFKLNLAYNAGDADQRTNATCYPDGGVAQLTATSRCLRNEFSWINHTFTHPKMNFTDYATSYSEIKQNLDVAKKSLGLTVPPEVLKTGEYSGLGVYNPDETNDIDPPTDYGLGASNPNLLAAAKKLGVKYLHGNMSFKSHQPACFNCGVVHPMETSLMIVPDWPTNIAYFSTTPEQETSFYNSFYGPGGKFAYWPRDLTYDEIIDYETGLALQQLATGSVYSHTMHIGNLRDYGGGRNLVFDWLDVLVAKYSSYYSVPLRTPSWSNLASYVADRNRHFEGLGAGVTGVYDPAANTITLLSPQATKVTVSGAAGSGSSSYGSDISTPITLAANRAVSVTARRLP